MRLLLGHRAARQKARVFTEEQRLRQCSKALCDAIDGVTAIVREESPDNQRVANVCDSLQVLADGFRDSFAMPRSRRRSMRIIGGR